MRGGAPRVVWQTLETDPRLVSARSAAQCLDQIGRPPHLVWNPLTGEIAQLIPVLRAGRSLGGPDRPSTADACLHGDPARVNREGRLCVQIAVVGFAREPFTNAPMAGAGLILAWLESWRIPRAWPAGPPPCLENVHAEPRSRKLWARGGHFGGSQVPDCCATGPGAIDIGLLTAPVRDMALGMPRRPHDVAKRREAAIPRELVGRDVTPARRDSAIARGASLHLGRRHEAKTPVLS